ncbi:MFS transporter [Actinoplanes sp. TBRC 11911]|uniref:MFS transporter n=1 Tax=Actinoplanes sp. TBRC 11911 TaxID=2729386 RepID=UPI00145EE265|nr:MFS transporter [Actinoplanes sp. TBRC 11911]NMO56428.1 MFS transporter [Actinoplanes sp. TBRC 11911]
MSKRLVIPVAAYGVLLVAVLQTLVVPVIGDIQADLGVSAAAASWVVTANLLGAAVLTPVLGRLGDLRGRRPVMIGVMILVIIGSILAATTSSLFLLVLARVLQASSFGLFPLGIGVLREEVPPHRLTGAMAVVSGMLAVGSGLGLTITGLLMRGDSPDYHQLFWLSTGLSVIALLGLLTLPRRAAAATGRLDWLGAGVLGLGLVLLVMPLEQGNDWGWGSTAVIGSLIGAVVVLALFVLMERRITQPLVSTRMLSHRPIVIAHVAGLSTGFVMFAVFLGVSALVQSPPGISGYGFGASVLATSVVYLLPATGGGILTAPLGGILVSRFGSKATLVIATLVSAAGFVLLAAAHATTWEVIVGTIAVMTGVMFSYAALPTLVVQHVDHAETGIANSVNSIFRSVGMSLGTAFVVTLLTRNVIPGLSVPLPQESQFRLIFVVGAAVAALTAGIVAFLMPRSRSAKLTLPQVEEVEALAEAGFAVPDDLVARPKAA